MAFPKAILMSQGYTEHT